MDKLEVYTNDAKDSDILKAAQSLRQTPAVTDSGSIGYLSHGCPTPVPRPCVTDLLVNTLLQDLKRMRLFSYFFP